MPVLTNATETGNFLAQTSKSVQVTNNNTAIAPNTAITVTTFTIAYDFCVFCYSW